MPKPHISSDMDFIISEFAYLKTPSPEILQDFEYILTYQLNRFRPFVTSETLHRMETMLAAAKKYKVIPKSRNRVYLITSAYIPELIMFNVEDCIIENLKLVSLWEDDDTPDAMPAKCFITLFIFSDDKVPCSIDISCKLMAELIRCFTSENLLSNAKIRDSWYGYPRRQNRKSV